MSGSKISIVIPAYNAEAHLPGSLASVRELRFPAERLEVIVVDDGSTDGTAARAEHLLRSLPVPSKVISQTNSGPSSARNTGWRAANGAWIQFLDADDWLAPVKLEVQSQSLDSLDSSVACIYSSWAYEGPRELLAGKGAPGSGREGTPQIQHAPLVALLRGENFIPFGAMLVRKQWLSEVEGFNEAYRFIEDVDLQLRIAMAGGRFQKVASDGPLFIYRGRDDSLSRSSRIEFRQGCVRNAKMVHRHWQDTHGKVGVEQRDAVLSVYENAMRVFALEDKAAFASTLAQVRAIESGFRPSGWKLRLLSRLLGLRNAYWMSSKLRLMKGLEP